MADKTRAAKTQDDTLAGGYRSITLSTNRGEIRCRYYEAEGASRGALWVGGTGGGWDTPARDLYPRLAGELTGEDIASLRVRFRNPGDLDDCMFDLMAGARFLETRGVTRLGFVGHSFGGAVVIRAAALLPSTRAVVTLATQGYGTGPAATLGPRCGLLLIHGRDDEILPADSSEYVHRLAKEPKRLVVFNGARHVLEEVSDRVHREVRDWLLAHLK